MPNQILNDFLKKCEHNNVLNNRIGLSKLIAKEGREAMNTISNKMKDSLYEYKSDHNDVDVETMIMYLVTKEDAKEWSKDMDVVIPFFSEHKIKF